MARGLGLIQKKILLTLAAHLSASLTYSFRQRSETFRQLDKELAKIDQASLRKAIDGLYRNKLVDIKENEMGVVTLTLNDDGRQKVLSYKFDEMTIKKPKRWDKKWRMVLFDIPHSKKKIREALRFHLKHLGFVLYQKSIFIHPFECQNEIEFLTEFYQIRPYVRQITASYIDNDLHLRKIFNCHI